MSNLGPKAIEVWRDYLRKKGWLAQTPEGFREAILSKTLLKVYEAGATVVHIGEEPRGLFGLTQGRLRLAIAPTERDPLLAHVLKPGDWFGEVPALTGQHHFADLVATSEAILLHVPLHALTEMLRDDPTGWRYLGQLCVEHLALALGAVSDLTERDPAKRFAAILMRLGGCRLATDNVAQIVDVEYTQEELGAISNLARTTVNALLKTLQQSGTIDLSYKRIRIIDATKMRAFISEPL